VDEPDRPSHPQGKAVAVIIGTILAVFVLAVISTLASR
jgi:hypothetical protein